MSTDTLIAKESIYIVELIIFLHLIIIKNFHNLNKINRKIISFEMTFYWKIT